MILVIVVLNAAVGAAQERRAEQALEMLEKLGCEFEERGEERLIPNINAMKCRMWLRLGMPENVERCSSRGIVGAI